MHIYINIPFYTRWASTTSNLGDSREVLWNSRVVFQSSLWWAAISKIQVMAVFAKLCTCHHAWEDLSGMKLDYGQIMSRCFDLARALLMMQHWRGSENVCVGILDLQRLQRIYLWFQPPRSMNDSRSEFPKKEIQIKIKQFDINAFCLHNIDNLNIIQYLNIFHIFFSYIISMGLIFLKEIIF